MTAALVVEVGGFAFDLPTHFWPGSACGFLLSILILRVMLYGLVFCALIAYRYHIPYCRLGRAKSYGHSVKPASINVFRFVR